MNYKSPSPRCSRRSARGRGVWRSRAYGVIDPVGIPGASGNTRAMGLGPRGLKRTLDGWARANPRPEGSFTSDSSVDPEGPVPDYPGLPGGWCRPGRNGQSYRRFEAAGYRIGAARSRCGPAWTRTRDLFLISSDWALLPPRPVSPAGSQYGCSILLLATYAHLPIHQGRLATNQEVAGSSPGERAAKA